METSVMPQGEREDSEERTHAYIVPKESKGLI